jgi:hypothetical protein
MWRMWEMIVEEEGYRTRIRKEELEGLVRTKVVKRGWHARSQSLVVKLAACSSIMSVGEDLTSRWRASFLGTFIFLSGLGSWWRKCQQA